MLKNFAKNVYLGRHSILAAMLALCGAALVACSSGGGNSGGSTNAVTTKAFGLAARAQDQAITLSWPRINDAKKYNLYWSLTSGVTKNTGTKIADATAPYEHRGLSNGVPVYYVYTVETSAGEGAESLEIVLAPSANAPGAPVYVDASGADGRVELFWCCVRGATSYNVYRKTARGESFGTPILTDATSPVAITGLQNDQTYYFAVTAVVGPTEKSLSNEVVAVTYVPEVITQTAGTVPRTPRHVYAFAGHQQVTIGADDQSDALRYSIYWNNTGDVTLANEHISNVALPYTHIGLTDGLSYYYRVIAQNQHGDSALSLEILNVPNDDKIVDTVTIANIPDANLRDCINASVAAYGWTYLRQLEEVDCENRKSIDLLGLDKLPNLRYVYLGQTDNVTPAITGFSTLTKLANLNELGLGGDGVFDSDARLSFLSGLMNLAWLDLSSNNATDVRLQTSTGLHTLDLNALALSNNPITNINSLTTFLNLETLYLDNTQITDYTPLAQLARLQKISLGANAISNLTSLASTLAKLSELERLHLENNQFSDLSPLATFNQLTELWVGRDGTDLDLTHRISTLEPLRNLTALTDLRFENNSVDSAGLSYVTEFTNLQALVFDNNKVDLLTALTKLKQLRVLSARGNQITTAHLLDIRGLTNLQSLALDSNPAIADIGDLAYLTALRQLSLSNNQISNIAPLAGVSQLTALNLYGNLIADVRLLADLSSLEHLDLTNNQIGGASIGRVDKLAELTQATYIGLGGNSAMSCLELAILIDARGSPPVDLDGVPGNVDIPTAGVSCSNP